MSKGLKIANALADKMSKQSQPAPKAPMDADADDKSRAQGQVQTHPHQCPNCGTALKLAALK